MSGKIREPKAIFSEGYSNETTRAVDGDVNAFCLRLFIHGGMALGGDNCKIFAGVAGAGVDLIRFVSQVALAIQDSRLAFILQVTS
jgi:hypothetical protein